MLPVHLKYWHEGKWQQSKQISERILGKRWPTYPPDTFPLCVLPAPLKSNSYLQRKSNNYEKPVFTYIWEILHFYACCEEGLQEGGGGRWSWPGSAGLSVVLWRRTSFGKCMYVYMYACMHVWMDEWTHLKDSSILTCTSCSITCHHSSHSPDHVCVRSAWSR